MNEKTINEQYAYIYSLLEDRRLKEALIQLESLLWQCSDWDLRTRLEQLQTSYKYMLDYMRQGANDPERWNLYQKMLTDTWAIADQSRLLMLDNASSNYYHKVRRTPTSPDLANYGIKTILHILESFNDDLVEMIHNIFEFGDKDAKDIMVHRKNIIAIDGTMTFLEMLDFTIENNYSRYPVYIDDIDNIIGVLHIKEVLALCQKQEIYHTAIKDIKGLIREVDFIPETRNINTLFTMMQNAKTHMVIVVDEYGQTSGIVAMEDILEEIVGNIEDEHDQEEKMIEKLPDGSYLMDGMTSAEEALEILKIHIPEEDEFETLNGILISLLDRIPNDDEKFETDAFGYHFEVLQVENKMIKKVKITKLAEGVSTDKEENSCQKEETVLE